MLTRGGPLYSPLHARSQRCDRSPSPCAGSPSPLLSLPWLPASPMALLYWFTPPTNAVCLCFAPPAPRSLISITLPLSPFSLFPSLALFFLSFFSYFQSLSLSPPTQPQARGENLTEHERRREKEMEGWGCGKGNGAFDFSLEAPPYFNIGFNRALMP